MAHLIKFAFWFFCALIALFISYSFIVLSRYKNIRADIDVPQPYRSLYKKFHDVPIVGIIMDKYRSDVSLIYNSDTYGKIYVAVYSVIIPCASVLIFIITSLLVDTWYFVIGISLFAIVIPYLMVTNGILAKSRRVRVSCIKIYESAERHFSNRSQVSDAFVQIAGASTGSLERLCYNFLEKYYTDSDEAYNYFHTAVGDKYALAFIRAVKRYDEYGVDPCIEITNTIQLARRHYQIRSRTAASVTAFKQLSIIVLVICLACAYMSGVLADSLGTKAILPELTYGSIAGVLCTIVLSLYYERQ